MFRRPSFPRRLLLVTISVGTLVAVSSATSSAAHPFVAGEASTHQVALPATAEERARAQAAEISRRLGLPDGTRRVERIDDRLEQASYDEVTTSNDAGDPVAVVRFSADGSPTLVASLDVHTPVGAASADVAKRQAERHVSAVGLIVTGSPEVEPSRAAGGWSVAWPRYASGARVRGDGVRVALWADGTFHSIAAVKRPLAPPPAKEASRDGALRAADAFLRGRFRGAGSTLEPVSIDRTWVAPNDTWDPARPDAPSRALRLAWVVRYGATGDLADRIRAVEVWLDAGTLDVLGGDVAE
jgi:hypothetical protein